MSAHEPTHEMIVAAKREAAQRAQNCASLNPHAIVVRPRQQIGRQQPQGAIATHQMRLTQGQ